MDLLNYCAICLDAKEDIFSIHKEVLGRSLALVIENISGIQISTIEISNFVICRDCATALLQAEEIIEKCRNSLRLLLENKVKLEPVEYQVQIHEDIPLNDSSSALELEETLIEIEPKIETAEFSSCVIEPEDNLKTSAAEDDAEDELKTSAAEDSAEDKETAESNKQKRKNAHKKEGRGRVLTVNCKANWHFKCELCTFESDFAVYYKNHLIDDHHIENPKIFKCPHCIQSYRRHSSMRKHVAVVHENKKPPPRPRNILCSECGKKFPCRNSLKIHMHVHTKEPLPFPCTEGDCKKAYASMASLKNHITSVHSQERKFSCEICGNTFALIYTLRIHMRKSHMSNDMQDCPKCGRSYRSLEKFEKHIQEEKCKTSVHPCQFPNCNKRLSSRRKVRLHMLHVHSNGIS